MDECEYCGDIASVDALVDGNYLRVCKKCVNNDMVIVAKPTKEQVEWSYKRPTVKQLLSGMAGIPRNSIEKLPNTAPDLSMLRTSVKESAVKRRLTSMKAESPDASQIINERAPKMPSPAIGVSQAKKDELESEDDFLDI